MSGFKGAWAEAGRIDGWYTEPEARLLHETALAVPEGLWIVEVGCWRGRSAAILADVSRPVLLLDPMCPYDGALEPKEGDVSALWDFVHRHDNVTWVSCGARDVAARAALRAHPVGLLHVDGAHKWPHPLLDYLYMESHLAPEALVAFHDAVGDKAPERTVRALVAAGRLRMVDGAGSLRVLRRTA